MTFKSTFVQFVIQYIRFANFIANIARGEVTPTERTNRTILRYSLYDCDNTTCTIQKLPPHFLIQACFATLGFGFLDGENRRRGCQCKTKNDAKL